MNRSPKTRTWTKVLAIAVCLLSTGSLAYMTFGRRQPVAIDLPAQVWFYDVETGELFAGPGKYERLPVVNPARPDAGATSVLAHVYACGDCADEKSRFVAYLETQHPNPLAVEPVVVARMPAARQQPRWINEGAPEAGQLIAQLRNKCDGQAKQCLPQ